MSVPFAIKKGWNSYVTAFLMGYLVHLVWDAVNVGSFWFYSIVFRYIVGFRIFT
jgi:hypothetical protein